MRGTHLRRLKKLEDQHLDDVLYHFERFYNEICEECQDIQRARDNLENYIDSHGPEPPRFYQYGEEEVARRHMWALAVDEKAQMLYRRFSILIETETERMIRRQEGAARYELIAANSLLP